jgi:hypothetical protein
MLALELPGEWVDSEDVVVRTGLTYRPDEPADVVVRKRGWRFDISEGGRAVELAGRPPGWLEVAERVVGGYALNINRRGIVFVQSNEGRLESLVLRVAECSMAVFEELLDCSQGVGP